MSQQDCTRPTSVVAGLSLSMGGAFGHFPPIFEEVEIPEGQRQTAAEEREA